MFQRKTPYEQEWKRLQKKEEKFFQSRATKKESLLNQKLEEKVPAKLQKTLDDAFAKAFSFIFEKGTGIIEKTYRKEELEKNYQIHDYIDQVKSTKKSLRKFSKKAENAGKVNLIVSGISGVGMGILGVGIPDIPVFTGMILRSVYEIALNYGYEYESEEERRFILLLIEGAISYGSKIYAINLLIDDYIESGEMPTDYDANQQIQKTAATLSKELLYMKFLQGIPVIGAVGGIYDAIYMKRITEFANLKYRRRFLRDRKKSRRSN